MGLPMLPRAWLTVLTFLHLQLTHISVVFPEHLPGGGVSNEMYSPCAWRPRGTGLTLQISPSDSPLKACPPRSERRKEGLETLAGSQS